LIASAIITSMGNNRFFSNGSIASLAALADQNDLPHRERIAQLRSGDRSQSHFNDEIGRLLRRCVT
jgi:hypothetical protein